MLPTVRFNCTVKLETVVGATAESVPQISADPPQPCALFIQPPLPLLSFVYVRLATPMLTDGPDPTTVPVTWTLVELVQEIVGVAVPRFVPMTLKTLYVYVPPDSGSKQLPMPAVM